MDIGAVIGVICAIVGAVVGLGGWLVSRDKRTIGDAEWRGCINGKLDSILGIQKDVERVEDTVRAQGERIAKVESSTASAHKRLDIIEGREYRD